MRRRSVMSDGNKTNNADNTNDEPEAKENRIARIRRRMRAWQIRQHVARGVAYGVGSGAVSLLVLWIQTRY
jgi:urease alpha subunit